VSCNIASAVRMYLLVPAADQDGITAAEYARRVGVHRRTAHRHLAALEAAGLVERDKASERMADAARWWRSERPAGSKTTTDVSGPRKRVLGHPGATIKPVGYRTGGWVGDWMDR
jgi:DNA-binding transcriptional ArsR family regulator